MSDQREITILMATYNGEAYVREQLDSILAQTHKNWKLVIRDDRSSDGTLSILLQYLKSDERISLITYGELHGSACENFSDLSTWALEHTNGLIMFADQDDIWEKGKIAVSLEEMEKMETQYGQESPLLCYSNFQFINENGEELPQKLILPAALQLRVLLNENHAWGCTMILNPALLKLVVPIPADAVNHDYWIALVASALGKTRLIDQPLIRYRQHTHNVSGNIDNMTFAKRFNRYITNRAAMIGPLSANLNTVNVFYSRFYTSLSTGDQEMTSSFIAAYKKGFIPLLITIFKYKIFKIGLAKNAAYLYTLLLHSGKVISQTKLNSGHADTLR